MRVFFHIHKNCYLYYAIHRNCSRGLARFAGSQESTQHYQQRDNNTRKMSQDWEEGSIDEAGKSDDGAGGDEPKGDFNVPAMAIGQVFPGESTVTSMDFHEDGELFVAANSDK